MGAQRARTSHFRGALLLRVGIAGGTTAALFFLGLWMLAQLPMGPSSILVNLYTSRVPATWAALEEGLLYAFLLGFSVGAIAYAMYYVLYRVEKRFVGY